MQQEGIIAVLLGWNAIHKAVIQVMFRVKTVAPGFGGERWIGDHKIKGLERSILVLVMRSGKSIIFPDLGGRVLMQNHVHARHGSRGVVHFLPVDGDTGFGFIRSFEQQRTGSAGRVIDGLGSWLLDWLIPITLAITRETSAGV